MLLPVTKFYPSKTYCILFLSILITGLIIIFAMPWPMIYQFALATIYIIYVIRLIYQEGLRFSPQAIQAVQCNQSGEWQVFTAHDCYQAKLCGDSTLTSLVAVLRFQIAEHKAKTVSCTIFKDACKGDSYRHLLKAIKLLKF